MEIEKEGLMKLERCTNLNHTKSNVTVRFCSACGEVVNKSISKSHCSDQVHAARVKQRNRFCVDCGRPLFKGV